MFVPNHIFFVPLQPISGEWAIRLKGYLLVRQHIINYLITFLHYVS